jgi:hypothetical protein
MAAAEERLGVVLASLPEDRWFVNRYVLVNQSRIPFLLVGETGVFAMWGGVPVWRDMGELNAVATNVRGLLPGWAGTVHAGICRAMEPTIEPRWWCRSGEPGGAWVMGLDWVIPWLKHFGTQHGFGTTDIQRLRAMARPRLGQLPPSDTPLGGAMPHMD